MRINSFHIFIFALLVMLIFACTKGRVQSTESEPTANENSPRAGAIAQMEPVSEVVLSADDIEGISGNLGVDIGEGINEFYDIDGVEVQINWVKPVDESNLVELYNNFVGMVGAQNAVILGTDRVYEVRCTEALPAIESISMLDAAPLQSIKLTPYHINGEASILHEYWITGTELQNVNDRIHMGLDALINQTIRIGHGELQINYMAPGRGNSADTLYGMLAEFKGSDVGLYVYENAVVEVVTNDDFLADKVMGYITGESALLSANEGENSTRRYTLSFTVIPVANVDPMKMNECSLEAEDGGDAEDLERIDPTIRFGNQLPVFLNEESTELTTDPDFTLEMFDDSVGVATIEAGGSKGEMPEVEVTMVYETGRVLNTPPNEVEKYTGETEFWPVGSDEISEIVSDVIDPGQTDTEKVRALFLWVKQNIDYGGDVVGSRWGVPQVLRQGEGRCWDQSDVFVTLARAAGVPTRQVAGWLYGMDSGHVWSQVWLSDQGIWLDVDTTAANIGVDESYIPIWGTIDGGMMFIYRRDPDVTRLGG